MIRLLRMLTLLLAAAAAAETLTLQPGSEGVDAEVNIENAAENYGDAEFILTDWPVG